MAKVKQTIIRKYKATNTGAKYRIYYRRNVEQKLSNNQLSYSYSNTTSLSYKGN